MPADFTLRRKSFSFQVSLDHMFHFYCDVCVRMYVVSVISVLYLILTADVTVTGTYSTLIIFVETDLVYIDNDRQLQLHEPGFSF